LTASAAAGAAAWPWLAALLADMVDAAGLPPAPSAFKLRWSTLLVRADGVLAKVPPVRGVLRRRGRVAGRRGRETR